MKRFAFLRRIFAIPLCAGILCTMNVGAVSYRNYTYNMDGTAGAEPQAYIPEAAYTGADLGAGDFSKPQDVFVSESGKIYVADTGNNRIVVTAADFSLLQIISGFENNGVFDTFSQPHGVFCDTSENLYIADTQNGRIVMLDRDGALVRVITAPQSDLLENSYEFVPIKVAADYAGRVYVVSQNCDQGIVQYNPDGSFLGYFGSIKTQSTVWELFWRSVATKSQKEAMSKIVPTEYSSIDVDADGFVYGTVSMIDTSKDFDASMFLHKLNSMGTDVLKRNGSNPPCGDILYEQDEDTEQWLISRFADVAVQDNGIYSALDTQRGRIFTYSSNGELLFVFGGLGTTLGSFGMPSAIDTTADNRFIVLDSKYNQLVVFEPTQYGALILQAELANSRREYEKSRELWLETLKYTSKSELVFSKIGDIYNSEGNYEKAMEYMRLANDRSGYSEAYQNLRKIVMNRYFGTGMLIVAVLVAAGLIFKEIRKKKSVS